MRVQWNVQTHIIALSGMEINSAVCVNLDCGDTHIHVVCYEHNCRSSKVGISQQKMVVKHQ